jgi:AmmeMemoRadiSam system protein A
MSRPSEESRGKLAACDPAFAALTPEFSFEQRKALLRMAHEAIVATLEGRAVEEKEVANWLLEQRGVFTTLYLRRGPHRHAEHQLRGCVGYAMPIAPLGRAVMETARAAAFDDSRFAPVTMEEAFELEISLSILSSLRAIHPDQVKIGRHGLLISDGARRGLLLPQVPVENGWDREKFLEQTCRKAGLPMDAWRNDARIEAFSAEVFGDFDFDPAAESA